MKSKKNKFTLDELADSYVFESSLTPEERKSADLELAEARRKNRERISGGQELYALVLQLRFLMEDYAKSEIFDHELSFASFLRKYIRLKYKVNKNFANDIDLKEAELSLILNRRRLPNEKTIVRLELHSNSMIPAISWYRVLEKEKEHELQSNIAFKQKQNKHVKNRLNFELHEV
ncbi:hypothetical protein [Aquirufa ecclesiirivi]|uniref:hypothetical protein n=1 Tax=Aquirufa ecclesiirivi TaxID=2715124 RepID=UPI00140B06A7|nr:hypothetical protein [Aquirufa ecclesiirivi]NHC49869.1 hypothetical protein [Aquirufa ecclesiirivi]